MAAQRSRRFYQAFGFPAAAGPISDDQARSLTAQLRELLTQRQAIRVSLASEPDAGVRGDRYRALANLGRSMAPLEQQLKSAGRPLPY